MTYRELLESLKRINQSLLDSDVEIYIPSEYTQYPLCGVAGDIIKGRIYSDDAYDGAYLIVPPEWVA